MADHEVVIASPPDRDKLVAELSDGDGVWAVVNQETEQFVIEILPRPDGNPWVFPLNAVLEAIERAAKRLSGELP
jgi:hypothetical protein